jgi:hypothetical protein
MTPAVSYVLPLRWTDDADLAELTAYLRWLADRAEVIVVDGSDEPLFDRHAEHWGRLVTHGRPDPALRFANGKVNGVTTGVRRAGHDKVVLADDDVRYDDAALARVVELLDRADVVRPQNVFDPMPWHARWDTGRTLLNRAVSVDYPGTFGLRRSTFLAMGGYDGDVLFENLELLRTVRAAGGVEVAPLDLYVTRRPPTLRRFLDQRVRQAYDDFAQPWRLLLWLSVVPATAVAFARRARVALLAGATACAAVAEGGRRRAGGTRVFPASASWFAPLWMLERGVCSWLALWQRVRHGGVGYSGRRLRTAAHPVWQLRTRLAAARRDEAGELVAPVAERLGGGLAAPAERDRAPTRVDLGAVLVDESERASHDERAVPVRRDGGVVASAGRLHADPPAR